MRLFITDLRIALTSLHATRVRTALTMLGIVIGVACITTVISLGEGAKSAIGSQLAGLGNDVLTIRPGKAERNTAGNITEYNLLAAIGATTITERDFNTISGVKDTTSAPIMLVTGSVKGNDKQSPGSQIIASNSHLLKILNLGLSDGDFLSETVDRNTVVIGADLADRLYDTRSALGRQLILRGQSFTVVGILKKNESPTPLSGFDLNNAAFVRLDAGKGFNQGIAQIQQVLIKAKNPASIDSVASTLKKKLLANHDNEEDFAVLRPEDSKQIASSTLLYLTAITSAIAAISILVGGVGIMNIMLVSVTERIREIGIRKSVGATNLQVLRQFLIEATVMSLGGGVIGVVIAYLIAFLIAIQFGFLPAVNATIIGIALGVSIATGLIFGSWPAFKAARKDPIEALRQFQ